MDCIDDQWQTSRAEEKVGDIEGPVDALQDVSFRPDEPIIRR
jgi:hypothetical protein